MTTHLFKSRHSNLLKVLTVVITFGALSPLGLNQSHASPATSSPHETPVTFWRKTDTADLFLGFRSNAPHYWNWLQSVSSSPTFSSRAFSIRGVVTGDPHILNFGDVPLKDGGRKLSLIDIDDSGVNVPLVGDFLRYLVGNQVSPFKVDAKDLFEAYKDGVSGKKMNKPDYLEKILSKSDSNFNKRQKNYIDKLTSKNRFNEKAGLLSIQDAPQEIKSIFEEGQGTFEKLMAGYTILDMGFKIKKTGGSQGLPRFWFLLKKQNEMHIWEFKQEDTPSTAYFASQPTGSTRFDTVSEIYRPQDEVQGPFQYVSIGKSTFLLRERFDIYMDLDPAKIGDKVDLEDGQQMSLYLANRLGRWHGEQNSGTELNSYLNDANSFSEIFNLMTEYIHLMTSENTKGTD